MALTKKHIWFVGGVTVIAVAVGAVFVVGGAINNAGQFDQNVSADCAPLVAIAFRGSGELNLDPNEVSNAGKPYTYGTSELVTNGWEGATLHGLFDELSETVYKEDFRADSIPVVPIGPAGESEPFGYDAIPAVVEASSLESALTFSKSNILLSAERGAEAASHVIQDYLSASEGCPTLPKFVLVGYSQGAMAARHTAELNPDSIVGVVNIGDPYQKPLAPGVRAGGQDGTGIIRWKADDQQKAQLDNYYASPEYKSSICHSGDPICEFSPVSGLWKLATGTYGDHLNYYTDTHPSEARTDAQTIARLGYEQRRLAQAAAEAGESVGRDDFNVFADGIALRPVSIVYAGTPTLFSATPPGLAPLGLTYEFDLDGDGEFETPSSEGIVWTTFDEDGPHTVGVRVTNPATGETDETETTVDVAPTDDGVLRFETGDGAVSVAAPATVKRGTRMAVSVTGGVAHEAALYPLDGGAWNSAPVLLAVSSWSSGVLVPESVTPGAYRLVVGVGNDGWGSTTITVVDELPVAEPPRETPVAQPAVRPAPAAPTAPVTPTAPASSVTFPASAIYPGQAVVIAGAGFTPNSIVTLTIEQPAAPATLAGTPSSFALAVPPEPLSVATDASGAFAAELLIPDDLLPGSHLLRVVDNGVSRDFPFVVDVPGTAQPSVEADRDEVNAVETFMVSGSGFPPNSAVVLSAAGAGLTLEGDPIRTDGSGDFSVRLWFDWDTPPGAYTVRVEVGGVSAGAPIIVEPGPSVN